MILDPTRRVWAKSNLKFMILSVIMGHGGPMAGPPEKRARAEHFQNLDARLARKESRVKTPQLEVTWLAANILYIIVIVLLMIHISFSLYEAIECGRGRGP